MNDLTAVDLSEHAFIRVQGAEALDFLQGQLSSDLRLLTAERAQISSYNSPKGRMLAVLHLLRNDGEILIELHTAVAASVLQRLRMFVLRAKLSLERATELRAIGLVGESAARSLAAAGLPVPGQPLDCAHDPQRRLIVMRRIGASPRYSLIGPQPALAPLAERWSPLREHSAWRRADIEAGVPVIYPQTSDHFVPQMANLDRLGGISFDKGCYTGQEIVARVHYLGQLKRRLFVCRVDGAAPSPAESVVSGHPAAAAGEIVDAVETGDGGALATAVLQLGAVESADLRLTDGRALHLQR
ncbi:folate-binding protein [Fontimonas sp. SYSU GA230001]|uniref:CAF17-like 4Fe-4S cluster assembly/insertion protein YgfZ n=1 Tax=Fontimonas sp. SYSU GA230001 TaxID=3142450 RepID=UPI0032B3B329